MEKIVITKKEYTNLKVGVYLFMALSFLSSFTLIYYNGGMNRITLNNQKPELAEDVFCYSESLYKAGKCLNNYIVRTYKFNPTDDKVTLTPQELREYGGDCYDYTKFYQTQLDAMGFKTKQIKFPSRNYNGTQVYHVFLLAYSEDGYVILDQNKMSWFGYGDINLENEYLKKVLNK